MQHYALLLQLPPPQAATPSLATMPPQAATPSPPPQAAAPTQATPTLATPPPQAAAPPQPLPLCTPCSTLPPSTRTCFFPPTLQALSTLGLLLHTLPLLACRLPWQQLLLAPPP